ncbi:ATP-dependent Clp protease proteolytic subunit [Fischerella muscicola CCMEE 5323]|uniref:ATP-dependent Clp protease proteolytic subunit n=1 Tax=Fischerella muscicola CCMEE 5323 TaxID=2019572 RepID=A0A2N6K2E1_FISMU|nr:ATP-dependent Clp protease proteolytic subunit [Fischerella muscicola]PLZ89201.1 ATP-dependent Clp protease proteolytic subunit [Fischerella muscicola CCMEE 5323]
MKSSSQIGFATIIQPSQQGEMPLDIYSRLLAERIIFIRGELTEEIANLIVAQMLFLDAKDPEQDITLYINSSGGSLTAALAIYDTMTQLRTYMCTVCIGTAAATAAFLLSSGTKGKRHALPNARITIRQPSGSTEGKATEIEVAAREIVYLRETMNRIIAANTGQPEERIKLDSERDFVMSAEEAKAYGLVDNIIQKTPASSH